MVVADNYLFARFENLEHNFISLLKKLLPQKLHKRPYELIVFMADPFNKGSIDTERVELLLNEQLINYFSYRINITIVKYKENYEYGREIHDRNIFTNYLWINSGFGFNLFSTNKIIKDTHISVFSVAYRKEPWQALETKNTADEYPNSVLKIRSSLIGQFKAILERLENQKGEVHSNPLLS